MLQNQHYAMTNHNNSPWQFIITSLPPTSSHLATQITTNRNSFMAKLSFASSLHSNPLFSSIVTLYILIFLYFPHFFLRQILSFSPLLVSTLILLLYLLRLGTSQQLKSHNDHIRAEKPEPHPISLDEARAKQGAKAESHCNDWVDQTRPSTEPGLRPEIELEIEPEKFAPNQQEEKTEPSLGPESEPEKFVSIQQEENAKPGQGPEFEFELEPEAKVFVPNQHEENAKPGPELIKLFPNQHGREHAEPSLAPELEHEPKTDKFVPNQQEENAKPGPEPELEPDKFVPKQQKENEPENQAHHDHLWAQPKPDPNMFCLEWDFGAPLEVIYEEYEGEETEDDAQNDAFDQENYTSTIERHPSLSKYYPESDSGSDSDSSEWDGEFPAMKQWDEEEKEGLIEIALEYYNHHDDHNKEMKKLIEDEDNMIEIDISPTRANYYEFSW